MEGELLTDPPKLPQHRCLFSIHQLQIPVCLRHSIFHGITGCQRRHKANHGILEFQHQLPSLPCRQLLFLIHHIQNGTGARGRNAEQDILVKKIQNDKTARRAAKGIPEPFLQRKYILLIIFHSCTPDLRHFSVEAKGLPVLFSAPSTCP